MFSIVTSLLLALVSNSWAGAEASSFKPENRKGPNLWNAGSAIDSNLKTAWMLPGDSENKGEWIMIEGPSSVSTLQEIGMVVGYAKNQTTFEDYARVKEVRIEVFEFDNNLDLQPTSKSTVVKFEDKMEMQVFKIPELKIESENGGKYRIIVMEVYQGKDYTNLAISELMLYLNDFEVVTQVVGVENEKEGAKTSKMIDDNKKTFWLGQPNAIISFESNSASLSRVGILSTSSLYARPKKVKVSTSGYSNIKELSPSKKVQWIWVPSITGYSGSSWDTVKLEILEVYPGKKFSEVAIHELDLYATTSGL